MWKTIPAEIQQMVKTAEISIDVAGSLTYSINRRGGSFKKAAGKQGIYKHVTQKYSYGLGWYKHGSPGK